MSSEIIVLTKDSLTEVIREAVALIAAEQRNATPAPQPTPEVLVKSGLADYLTCSIGKIESLMKRVIDPVPYDTFGDHPRFRKTEVDEWLKRQPRVGPLDRT